MKRTLAQALLTVFFFCFFLGARAAEEKVYPLAFVTSLPDRLSGFLSDDKISDYESNQSGMGYSKSYWVPGEDGIWATVYVYTLDMKNIKNGFGTAEFKQAWNASVSEISALEGRVYSGIEKTDEKDFGVPSFREYSFRAKRIAKDGSEGDTIASSLFLTVSNGAFVKVRASYYPDEIEGGREKIAGFMTALSEALKMGRKKQ